MKIFLGSLLVFALLLAACFIEPTMAEDSCEPIVSRPPPCMLIFSPAEVNCGGKCKERCSKAGIQDRCMKYCGICCEKCKCVPSGTYGNKHECPCYRDMINSKGKPKCP